MKKQNAQQGFSLLELVVVIAIIGVLTAFGVPRYGEYVNQSRRIDGMSELTRVMQQQEKYFLNAMTYVTDLSLLGFNASGGKITSTEEFYEITASACSGTTIARCVLLTAEPVGVLDGDGDFTIDSRGMRDWEGNGTDIDGWP